MDSKKRGKRLVVVGDIHGQLDGFVKILRHAKLIDAQQNWCGSHVRLLQIGDVFDRGPHGKQADALLDKLQHQAAQQTGCEVIRLVGNHELEMLLSNFAICRLPREEAIALRDKLTKQVLDGELRGAYAYKGYLFTHAGVTNKLYRIFKMQLADASAANIATLINVVFKESISHQFFKHPIFNISVSRAGPDRFGGIFWEDLTDLVKSYPQSPFWQVIGHTQVEHIIVDPASKLIPVDVGMHRKLQYFEMSETGETKICTVEENPA